MFKINWNYFRERSLLKSAKRQCFTVNHTVQPTKHSTTFKSKALFRFRQQKFKQCFDSSVRCITTSVPVDSETSYETTGAPEIESHLNDEVSKQLKWLAYEIVRKSPTTHVTYTQQQHAHELVKLYYQAEPLQKFAFICFLADDLSLNIDKATHVVQAFLNTQQRKEPYDASLLIERLRLQVRPQYFDLFRQIAKLPNGVKFLVDIRGDLLTFLANPHLVNIQKPTIKVNLRLLSTQLAELFLSLWFSAGFVRMERLTWDSPTSILQKITEYEAVHPINDWIDLKNRLGLYRRCYMFGHSCLPGEPLVILHVALVPTISSSIQEIIQKTSNQAASSLSKSGAFSGTASTSAANSNPFALPFSLSNLSQTSTLSPLQSSTQGSSTVNHIKQDQSTKSLNPSLFSSLSPDNVRLENPKNIEAAIFYSISSTQKGLNGIDLGNQLIKKVAAELKSEFPSMNQFSTLSPIPNFNEYLFASMQSIQRGEDSKNLHRFWTGSEYSELRNHIDNDIRYLQMMNDSDDLIVRENIDIFWSILIKVIKTGEWLRDTTLVELLEQPLMRICAYYLYAEKRRGYALNSVANFHLKNGAVMWRLNWLADTSARGMAQSCGIMMNYRYYLDKYQENSSTYLNDKQIIVGNKFAEWLEH